MKIIFVKPYSRPFNYEPPLGIASLAAFLRENNIKTGIIDANTLRLNNSRVLKKLKAEKADLVGITSTSYDRFEGFGLAEEAKKAGFQTVLGGPHASFTAEETMKGFQGIDFVVQGEGEIPMLKLCKVVETGKGFEKIKGLAFRKGRKIINNQGREFIEDIDKLPMPAYDLLPMQLYGFHAVFGSRGCPFNCKFCASPALWQRRLRIRSPEKVVDEIEFLLENYGKKTVHLKDDTFTARKDWVKKICSEIKKRKLGIEWECMGRINTVDEEILQTIKNSGCKLIEYGIESGNNEMLKKMGKNITKEQIRKVVELTNKIGIRVGLFFIIGHPGETLETAEETGNFAAELKCEAGFSPMDILPGTQNYSTAVKDRILPEGFSWNKEFKNMQGFALPRYENPGLPEEKMEELAKRYSARVVLSMLKKARKEDLDYAFKSENPIWYFVPRNSSEKKMINEEVKKTLGGLPAKERIKTSLLYALFNARTLIPKARKLAKKAIKAGKHD